MRKALHRYGESFVFGAIVGVIIGVFIALMAGCTTVNNPSVTILVEQRTPDPAATIERAALIVGVLSTPSTGYGRPLLCPGADLDAQFAEEYYRARGITNIVVLRDMQATKGAIIHAVERLTKDFGPEDLLVIHYSGHGGRVKDYSGDEPSGWDSTWCLSGGPWLDDAVGAWVQTLKPFRIIFIADACHSEGSWRNVDAPDMDVPRGFAYDGTIIQLAACKERESAWGNTLGGQWSVALYSTISPSLAKWFSEAAALVDGQTPVMQTYGPLVDWTLNRKPLE